MRFLTAFVVTSGIFASKDCDADHVSAFQSRSSAESTLSIRKLQKARSRGLASNAHSWADENLASSDQCTDDEQLVMLDCLTRDADASSDLVRTVRDGNFSIAREVLLDLENLDCPALKTRMRCLQQNPCWWTSRTGTHLPLRPVCDAMGDRAVEILGTSTTINQVCSQTPENVCKMVSPPGGIFDQCGLSCDAPLPFLSGEACPANVARLESFHCQKVALGMRKKFVQFTRHQSRLPRGCYNYNGAVYWNWWGSKGRTDWGRKTRGRELVCNPDYTTTTTTTMWTLSGEACAGASLLKNECILAAKNKGQKFKSLSERYQKRRPGGCYRYKGSVWWNAEATGITKRGRKALCLASDRKILLGEICSEDNWVRVAPRNRSTTGCDLTNMKVPILYSDYTGTYEEGACTGSSGVQKQLGHREHCNYAGRLVNKKHRSKIVPESYQSHRPGGCYKYRGAVWWNPNPTGTAKKGREIVCFEATLNLGDPSEAP